MRQRAFALAASLLLVAIAAASAAQTVDSLTFANLKWRLIGPFRGGRSIAVAGVTSRPTEFYMGATGGGVWKSSDSGDTWKCVSDGFFESSTIGALQVSESDPDIVWAGTGEGCVRGNITVGEGVYKSTDAGKSWTHMGLRETQTATRIRIHPTNPDIVYVAALGHIFGPNKERGVYKTTDGGKTWKQVLFVSDKAGAVDLCMDAKNPEVLYAATWEVYRTPYTLSSGGPGSKIFKSTDGGKTWTDLSANPGLPKGVLGRIGIAVSPANPQRLYASVEALDGGLFTSTDGGATWALTSDNRNYRQRAWYYSHVYADPKDEQTMYVLNVGAGKSTNGGKTFTGFSPPHSDNHDLWINPNDPKIWISGNDGGASVTKDAGRTWTAQDMPTAQFYHVTTDSFYPYRVYGAQQDNSSIRIASRTFGFGIGRTDWEGTAGGESGYHAVKPDDPDIVFGGNYSGDLSMINHRTGDRRQADPWPDNPMGHGAIDSVQRFQWTFPILFSPHNPNKLYTCSQFVLESTDLGQSWKKISPDLTRNDPKTLQSSGGPITKDNTGVEVYGTVFTLAESPVQKGVLWAGSDDGLVHVTRNGGRSWTNVTPKGLPEWVRCSMIEASPHDAGSAFLAANNFQNDDRAPYVYVTHDYGKTWERRVNGIPREWFVRVVREDPKRKGLLFAGTERGVFVTWNDGLSWQPLKINLPNTPIHDLTIKDDDLVAATHGRAFWILDDISPLRQLDDAKRKAQRLFVFNPRDAVMGGGGGRRGPRGAGSQPASDANEEMGENPMRGLVVGYQLNDKADSVTIEMFDRDGVLIGRSNSAPTEKGFQRATISTVNYPGYRSFPNMIFWFGTGGGVPIPPGTYKVKVTAKGKDGAGKDWTEAGETTIHAMQDPRWSCSEADLQERTKFARQIVERVNEANDTVVQIRNLKADITQAITDSKDDGDLKLAGNRLSAALSAVEEELYQVKNRAGQDPLNYPIKLNNKLAALLGVVQGNNHAPTAQSREVYAMLTKLLKTQLDLFKGFTTKELADFNKLATAKGLKAIAVRGKAEAGGGGGFGGEEDEDRDRDGDGG
ncbi:MAG: glycosyl hydrolase [Armatimonadetes bacterium]|nr:glycosyl hydrolase [Armatimonadota bacterium]